MIHLKYKVPPTDWRRSLDIYVLLMINTTAKGDHNSETGIRVRGSGKLAVTTSRHDYLFLPNVATETEWGLSFQRK